MQIRYLHDLEVLIKSQVHFIFRLNEMVVLIQAESEAHRQRKNCDYQRKENTLLQASEDVLAGDREIQGQTTVLQLEMITLKVMRCNSAS